VRYNLHIVFRGDSMDSAPTIVPLLLHNKPVPVTQRETCFISSTIEKCTSSAKTEVTQNGENALLQSAILYTTCAHSDQEPQFSPISLTNTLQIYLGPVEVKEDQFINTVVMFCKNNTRPIIPEGSEPESTPIGQGTRHILTRRNLITHSEAHILPSFSSNTTHLVICHGFGKYFITEPLSYLRVSRGRTCILLPQLLRRSSATRL
jgi:hypothetical protein